MKEQGGMKEQVGPILMGVAYLALVVFLILFCAERTSTFDEFSKYWGLFATLVGVVTGAIPSFFFKSQADRAEEKASVATDYAEKAAARAEAYAGVAPEDRVRALHAERPDLFGPQNG